MDVLNKHKKADLKAACIEIDQERWFVNSLSINSVVSSINRAIIKSR